MMKFDLKHWVAFVMGATVARLVDALLAADQTLVIGTSVILGAMVFVWVIGGFDDA